jgi:probable addiction module antidote protein
MGSSWAINDAAIAQRRLERLASSLEANHPGAAGSVREGLSETRTLQRLGVAGALYRKLRTTNAIENLNSGIATYTRAETRAHRLATSSEPGATGKIKGVGPMTSNRKYEEVLDEDLQNPAEAAQYLSACLESGEPEVFLLALRDVARARGGVAKLAELTELNREHLYRMLSENGNPELRSLETLLDALGFRLAVALKEAS